MKKQRTWVYSPKPASSVPRPVKESLTVAANEIVETAFKPEYLKPLPKESHFNHIVDIYVQWRGHCLLFRSKYACLGPNALSPFFESSFARIACMANGTFDVAYMRHTGKWWTVYTGLSQDEALATIRDEIIFHPSG